MFAVLPIDRRRAEAIEPLGTKSKFWFTHADGRRLLFKAEERGTGEDWAEKLACELAQLLGLPHVQYELAQEVETATPGVVCASLLEPGEALAHGNQLLLEADPNYPRQEKRFKVAAHTVQAVSQVMGQLGSPASRWMTGAPTGVTTALEVFAGYLLLDAWVANQDRHHENWGAARAPGGAFLLAPTFDHGASLARNLSDDERYDRMTTKDENRRIGPFARRARSALYADAGQAKPLSTVAAWNAWAAQLPGAKQAWLARLAGVEREALLNLISEIPPQRMTATCRDFTIYLLEENRKRLLDDEVA